MPRDLFGSITAPPIHVGTRSKYSVPLSFLAHIAAIVPLIVIPILATDFLPEPPTVLVMVGPPPAPPEPPPPVRKPADPPPPPAVNPDAAPVVAPQGIEPEKPIEITPFEHATPIDGGVPGTTIDTIAPPPPPPPPPAPTQPVRVGFGVRQPTRIRDAAPVYPAIAREARIEGVVIIEALIDVDGRVQQARVLRSTALLDQAALDAVRQWQYTPTLLNGQPMPVLMTVTVMFKLQ
jgi:protein TonB